jgi:hypothetical protein
MARGTYSTPNFFYNSELRSPRKCERGGESCTLFTQTTSKSPPGLQASSVTVLPPRTLACGCDDNLTPFVF